MALDYGERRVGVAISDELQLIARPLTTIRREKKGYAQIIDRIRELVDENEVATLVVGLPLNMDGSRGAAVDRVESFISDLRRSVSIPVVAVDERLTSREADRMLREMGMGLRERRARSDEYAASVILQDYIDEQRRTPMSETSP
ncbi:MAG TPA: Holliday junction resolvase RuvX [Blastocatellia bacterium]|nr:Holliday junction resolvase RuvX [Blastocatellia bacterium]HKQ89609.1 Holliday junction resolvase RuvX [Blastocatellia bacterium]